MATGHIRKRTAKNGAVSYQITVESERNPLTGERERSYKTVKGTKKQAEATLRKMISEVENGGIVNVSPMKLGDWMGQWLDIYLPHIEATTRAGYKERIKKHLLPALGNIPLKNLNATIIQQWVNSLTDEKNLSPKTVQNVYLNLEQALTQAVFLRMLPYNPCEGVKLPKLQKYKAQIYDKDEITEMLEAASGSNMYLIALLTVSVGFRRGELLALKWDNVDLDNGIIHIRENTVLADGVKITKAPKSSAGIRDISIGEKLTSELRKAHTEYFSNKLLYGKAFVDSNLVICQKDGKPYSPDSITQKWGRFVKQKNLKHIRFHDLRHSCATAMIEANVPMKTVQERMGHTSITITYDIYGHCTKTMNESAADVMDNVAFSQANLN